MQKKKAKPKVIVLTGGHGGSTALATVQAAAEEKKDWKIYWIGTKKAIEGKAALTLEFKIFPKYGIKCYSLTTGRFQKRFSRYTIPSLLKLPIGFFQSLVLLIKLRPKVVVSYGGFAAFPVVFWAFIFRIPVIIHEQTTVAGLSNKLSASLASKIAISRKQSAKFFPAGKTILTGNPVSKSITAILPKKTPGEPMTIFIIGGSRGSRTINHALSPIIIKLLKKFMLIHITGEEDYLSFKNLKKSLPKSLANRYKVYNFVEHENMPKFFKKADIIISRGGANTISEIITSTRPAIIIPIPWTRYNEQEKNAELVESIGLGVILNQNDLTANKLLTTIDKVAKNWDKMNTSSKTEVASLDKNAAKNLVSLINNQL